MQVAELMRTPLITVAADASIADAIAIFADADVSALPVVDRTGRAVGVLTSRDLLEAESKCRNAAAREHLFEDTLVLEIMTPWPATIRPDVDVRNAALEMLYLGVQRLFVERDGVLVGVVSQTDIVGVFATARV